MLHDGVCPISSDKIVRVTILNSVTAAHCKKIKQCRKQVVVVVIIIIIIIHHQARILAVSAPHSGDWLHALPRLSYRFIPTTLGSYVWKFTTESTSFRQTVFFGTDQEFWPTKPWSNPACQMSTRRPLFLQH